MGYGSAQDKAARLDSGDLVDLLPRKRLHELIDRAPEPAGVGEKGRHVTEPDSGLRVVRNRPDDGFEIHGVTSLTGRKARMAESDQSDKPARRPGPNALETVRGIV